MLMAAISASGTTIRFGYAAGSSRQRTAKPVLGGDSRDQLDDHAVADEGLGAPVLADEGEETVLNFVDVEFIGLRLQFAFPQSHARAGAAAPVGLSLWAILSAVVGKIANGFLFLGVDRDGRPLFGRRLQPASFSNSATRVSLT
jgi:hypothetical protein